MRKALGAASLLAFALLFSGTAMSRPREAAGSCPMTNKQPGKYCEKCMKVLDAKDIKDGKCAADQSALLSVQVCVKDHFVCGCNKGNCCTDDKEKAGNCKCGKPLKKDSNSSLITYTCAGCSASSPVKDKLKHADDCKKKDVKAACGH